MTEHSALISAYFLRGYPKGDHNSRENKTLTAAKRIPRQVQRAAFLVISQPSTSQLNK
jgi:hypothetical protein